MSKVFNLSDDVDDGFELVLKDAAKNNRRYYFKYPSAKDLDPIKEIEKERRALESKLTGEISEEEKANVEIAIEELEKRQTEVFYKLINPLEHEIAIADILKDVNVKVLAKFNNLIKEQLSTE